jgi:hypothetical protein
LQKKRGEKILEKKAQQVSLHAAFNTLFFEESGKLHQREAFPVLATSESPCL